MTNDFTLQLLSKSLPINTWVFVFERCLLSLVYQYWTAVTASTVISGQILYQATSSSSKRSEKRSFWIKMPSMVLF